MTMKSLLLEVIDTLEDLGDGASQSSGDAAFILADRVRKLAETAELRDELWAAAWAWSNAEVAKSIATHDERHRAGARLASWRVKLEAVCRKVADHHNQ